MTKPKTRSKVPMATLTDAQRRELEKIERDTFLTFEGTFVDLERAIGMLHLGHQLGWKPLVLMHSKRTIAKYEEILDIAFRDVFPEEGPSATRSVAYKLALKLSNFWKAVSGETPMENRQRFERGGTAGTRQPLRSNGIRGHAVSAGVSPH